jgi:hypothetical protein
VAIRSPETRPFKAPGSISVLDGFAPLAMTSVGEPALVCLDGLRTRAIKVYGKCETYKYV